MLFIFLPLAGMDQSETDTDSETPMGHASIWVQTHTIFYRPVPDNDPCNYASPNAAKNTSAPNVLLPCGSASGTRKGKGANGKSSNKKKGDDLWIGKFFLTSLDGEMDVILIVVDFPFF